MTTLIALLNRAVEKNPNHIAYIFGNTKIEYGKVVDAVNRLAQGLSDLGVKKGDRVAILLPNLPHFPISYYAIQLVGAIVVPINFTLTNEKILSLIKDCSARIVISWAGFGSELLEEIRASESVERLVLLGTYILPGTISLTQLIASSTPLPEQVDLDPATTAVISYTPGTIFPSRGVELTHANLTLGAQACWETLRLTSEDIIAAAMPLYMSVIQALTLNVALVSRSTVVLQPRLEASEVVHSIINNKTSFLPALPGLFTSLAQLDLTIDSTHLNFCLSIGGRISEKAIKEFESKFHTIILEGYTMTEVGSLIACNRVDMERKMGSVGLPVIGTEMQVLSDNGRVLPPEEIGEIAIRSANVMKGYYNRPEETATMIKEGWFLTGDLGKVDQDQYFYIIERKSDVIVKSGFRVFPGEVEDLLNSHPAVKEVAVIGIPDESTGEEVKAFVVLEEEANVGSYDLINYCTEKLSRYKCPKNIDFIEALPRSKSGKILRRKLREKIDDFPDFDDIG